MKALCNNIFVWRLQHKWSMTQSEVVSSFTKCDSLSLKYLLDAQGDQTKPAIFFVVALEERKMLHLLVYFVKSPKIGNHWIKLRIKYVKLALPSSATTTKCCLYMDESTFTNNYIYFKACSGNNNSIFASPLLESLMYFCWRKKHRTFFSK